MPFYTLYGSLHLLTARCKVVTSAEEIVLPAVRVFKNNKKDSVKVHENYLDLFLNIVRAFLLF